jgi:hypothetical protein
MAGRGENRRGLFAGREVFSMVALVLKLPA